MITLFSKLGVIGTINLLICVIFLYSVINNFTNKNYRKVVAYSVVVIINLLAVIKFISVTTT